MTDTLGPLLALVPMRRRKVAQIAIVDGTLIPTRDHRLAAPSKNYRLSMNLQVAIDASTRLVIAVDDPTAGQPQRHGRLPHQRHQGKAGRATGDVRRGYRSNPEVIVPYRKPSDGSDLPVWKQALNVEHRTVRQGSNAP